MKGGTGDDLILTERSEGVVVISLNRPDRLNAWSAEMESQYFDALDEADAASDVRVIVVTGRGRGFCAGVDMAALSERARTGQARVRDGRPFQHALSIRKPMIAAVNGGCAGVGLLQALFCDIRFAAEEAKITTAFARRGVVAEYGASWLLERLIGPGRAADLLLSGRVVTGAEAATMGLVNASFPDPSALLAHSLSYAQDIARSCSPAAMAAMKKQLADDWLRTRSEAERDAVAMMADRRRIPDFEEGVAAFAQRRAPMFAPLVARPGAGANPTDATGAGPRSGGQLSDMTLRGDG